MWDVDGSVWVYGRVVCGAGGLGGYVFLVEESLCEEQVEVEIVGAVRSLGWRRPFGCRLMMVSCMMEGCSIGQCGCSSQPCLYPGCCFCCPHHSSANDQMDCQWALQNGSLKSRERHCTFVYEREPVCVQLIILMVAMQP